MIQKNYWFIIGGFLALACIIFIILGGLHAVQATHEGNWPIFYAATIYEMIFLGGISGLLSYFSFKKYSNNLY